MRISDWSSDVCSSDLFPLAFGVGAVPPDASPELVSLLRLLGGPFLGIAALNWQSRKEEPSALGNILLANLIGFGVVALNDIVGVATGAARDIAKIFLIIHLLFALAFGLLARASRMLTTGRAPCHYTRWLAVERVVKT